ncbi:MULTISPECIES: nuclease [Prochlorococcus]|uniref:nuclease n=1 Tax=Prochlorococcus TaxID=1218 RepID=UPI00187C6CD3|nr:MULTISPECIES: nuclease [Prochlorococcus]
MILCSLPIQALAAEVFQINNSTTIQIGDQNRIYSIKIACLSVKPENEEFAFKYLKKELPRRTKVNLKPVGYEEGKLLSKVIKISSQEDLGNSMKELGLADWECD